jgi:methionyl-tRNA formyltransferase
VTVAFLGNSPWSVPSLSALAETDEVRVAGVFTRPPVPAGRGSHLTPTLVADRARELELPLIQTATIRKGAGLESLESIKPDILVVVAYGEILPPDVLAIPRLAPVNLHFSLLPQYRGSAPVQRALLEGRTTTGVSVMLMDAGTDTGGILAQEETHILASDDSGTLGDRLAEVGARLLAGVVASMAKGSVPTAIPQDDAAATAAPRITSREIDWGTSATQVLNFVRALGPAPGAATGFRGTRLKLLRAGVAEGSGEPGAFLRADPEGPVVAAGEGAVVLLDVAPAGRKHMSGSDFARGSRLVPGDRFGDSA